jgi:hypothetical protein
MSFRAKLDSMRAARKRLVIIVVLALVLAAPAIVLVFLGIAGPRSGLTHLHRSLATAEARILLSAPALLRVPAVGATSHERAVWNELLLQFSTTEHPVAVNPTSAWPEASKDAVALFDRVVEGSPNFPGESQASWAVHDFLIRNAQPERIPVEGFAPRIVAVDRDLLFSAVERRPGSERVAQRLGAARAYVSLSRVGFTPNGQFALIARSVLRRALRLWFVPRSAARTGALANDRRANKLGFLMRLRRAAAARAPWPRSHRDNGA